MEITKSEKVIVQSVYDEGEEEDDEEDATSTNEDEKERIDGAYDSTKYDSLNVSPEIKNLFSFITFYTPQMIEINTKLKPFIPDYIPAVGDVDAFIKVPLPGNPSIENNLGYTVLDEPNLNQSDSALLQFKLKAMSREVDSKDALLRQSVVQSTGTGNEIETWIENIKHLHETMARPDSVTLLHSNQRNDIDELMQEWHSELETALTVHSIPTPELDCSLDEYINILCAILDIPIQSNKISSLYLLFSLYHEFKTSQHFKKMN